MKKFGQGFIVGVLVTILLTSGIVMAADPIRLFVNGQEIQTDVAPQIIDGRVMVPAKFVAEPLGANVMWDSVGRAVIVRSIDSISYVDVSSLDLIDARKLSKDYNVKISGKVNQRGYTMSVNNKKIIVTNYVIMDSALYFYKDVLNQLGIQ